MDVETTPSTAEELLRWKKKEDVDAQSNNLVDREEIYGRIAFI
jgi:hypothetical protein